jgi:outer membrane receptor for ferrienterochelin and colicins
VTEIDDESRDNQEAFVQLEALHGPWTIVPGVRVQEDSDFGSHISPKISLRHDTTEQLFFRFSLGDGYRVPNLKERFYLFDHSHIGYILLGNPELQPEESISAQASVTFTDYSRFQAEFALFRNELTDLIELEPVRFEQGVQYYEYTNVQEAITQGIELSGSYAFAFGLKVQGGYTYLYSKNITRGHELNDRPEHQIKTSLNYSSSFGLDVSLIASWQSKAKEFYYDRDQVTLLNVYETDAWSQLDLKISQEVYASAHQTFSVYGGIDNITDEIQDFSAPFDNRPEVGRVAYLGATYEF